MCLIVDRPAGKPIDRELLLSGIGDNPHGWGIMAKVAGRRRRGIDIVKGTNNGRFLDALDAIGDRACTIHFRFATHGTKSEANCHPFPMCGGKYALMHNGIIDVPTELDPTRSDTFHFAEYVLGPMLAAHPDRFGDDEFGELIGKLVGDYNKLVILRDDGRRMIVNRGRGLDHQGLWLSNGHSLPRAGRSALTPVAQASFDRYMIDWRDDETDLSDRGEPVAARRSTLDDNGWFQLSDFEGWDLEDIVDACLSDPESVADAIQRHLD